MARFFKKREINKGLPPGSLVFIGNRKVDNVQLRLIDYNLETLTETSLDRISDGEAYRDTDTVSWINIDGIHDTDIIQEIGTIFKLHPLLLEDVLNTGQRPKLEEFDTGLFMVVKMLRWNDEENIILSEQLSIVLGQTFLLTFQEQPGDVFEPVRDRIRKHKGRIRQSGPDYLAYALLDTVVDNYIYVIEHLGERIEDIEEAVLTDPGPDIIEIIHLFKREMNFLRKSIRPAREAVIKLSKSDSSFVDEATIPFIKDLEDLVTQAAEVIDTYRDMLTDLLNLYNSAISNRMNDIMKVLTIFAAIFIPLTFIAGIYGTNFEYMPELHFKYAYIIFWGVLLAVALFMLLFFKRKKWL